MRSTFWYCRQCGEKNEKGSLQEVYEDRLTREELSGQEFCTRCYAGVSQGDVYSGLLDEPAGVEPEDFAAPGAPAAEPHGQDTDSMEIQANAVESLPTDEACTPGEELVATQDPAESSSERLESLLEIAAFTEEQSGDPVVLQEVYSRILAHDPTHEGAFERLAGMYERSQEWKKLIDLFFHRYEHMGGSNEDLPEEMRRPVAQNLYRLATILMGKANDPDQGAEFLYVALDMDPTLVLEPSLLEGLTDDPVFWKDFSEFCIESAAAEPDDLIACGYLTLACDYFMREADTEKAMDVLKKAQKRFHDYSPLHRRLAACYRADSSTNDYIRELEKALKFEKSEEDRFDIAMELGGFLESALQDLEGALKYYRQAAEIHPDNPALIAKIGELRMCID
ncbi:hypothetical protein KKF84_02770 [Myxococcota bacterium]|nr:hypothetical protein [Myxococcota bacterium]MBU1534213.1 hypothetical protein [Myxococcota bacterium]